MLGGSLLLALMVAGSAQAASGDCPREDGVRRQAECIHDAMSPDVIGKLYRLALSTMRGKSDLQDPPGDFRYIAEEAGEAARRKGPKPLVEMAKSKDVRKLAFAARAMTAFLDAILDGRSHRDRFANKGDAKRLADARKRLRAPCKRLAGHDNEFLRDEGRRCLDRLDVPFTMDLFRGGDLDTGMTLSDLVSSSGGGGLRATSGAVGLATPEASSSYRARCDQGEGQGCYLLAELNRFERFGPNHTYPKNLPRAVELYQRGCDLGFAMSCSDLAGMLRDGEEIPRDRARAAALDRQACKLGRKASCRN